MLDAQGETQVRTEKVNNLSRGTKKANVNARNVFRLVKYLRV
jgi:hypothetical protein